MVTVRLSPELAEKLLEILAHLWASEEEVNVGQWSALPVLIEAVEDAIDLQAEIKAHATELSTA